MRQHSMSSKKERKDDQLPAVKDCFERVYMFSPSIHVAEDAPELYYDHYDAESLKNLITTQRKIIEHQTSTKILKNSFQCQMLVSETLV